MTDKLRIGFCGFGVMGSALAIGLLKGQDQREVFVYDPVPTAGSNAVKATWLKSNKEVVDKQPDILFLCTKPQYIVPVCREIAPHIKIDKTIIISVAAGMSITKMEEALPKGARLVRCMPNIPCTVQSMAAGVCGGSSASKEDVDYVCKLLGTLGTCVSVANEDLLNAVTGLSGSGPAYIFMIIEALADGGVRNGLPRATALELAMHTVKGAAEMCIQTKTHPAVLKDQVCSPGGTTIAAVAALEDAKLRSAMIEGVTAATVRSRELSQL